MLRLALCLCVLSSAARACETALLLAMDVSNSVDAAEYRIQTDGLALALRDPSIAEIVLRDRVALAVLQWSGPDRQELSLGWLQPGDTAGLAALAARVETMPRAFLLSDTAPGAALMAALDVFATAPDCKRRIIDMSGDGTPNAGSNPAAARVRAERMGVTVNGLAIEAQGAGLPVTNFYRRSLATRDGFVMTARSHRGYAETLRAKMLRELSRVLG
ncbi:DUF1194 domain-containing protein [Salipiger marinus]|uniref:DUF1194 domain-containing protein n=1 Tax=Salipiger marinus TaxID=555512 RepID=UPI0040586A3F